MVRTVCGAAIDEDGLLVAETKKSGKPVKPVTLQFENQTLYFCEEACKEEFLDASDKKRWIGSHQ